MDARSALHFMLVPPPCDTLSPRWQLAESRHCCWRLKEICTLLKEQVSFVKGIEEKIQGLSCDEIREVKVMESAVNGC